MSSTTNTKVFVVGATGNTGISILKGLLEAGTFDVTALIRPASADKPAVQALKSRNVAIHLGSITDPLATLVSALKGQDIVISAVGPNALLEQFNLVDACSQAGIKRFIPCGYITVSPPGGVMILRDQKEEIHRYIRKLYLPYTIIDVGYWYQISFPPLPSGVVNYAVLYPFDTIYGDGNQKTLITDLRDVGRFVAKIISDERTLNKSVVTVAEFLSQNEIFERFETFFGEKVDRKYESAEKSAANLTGAQAAFKANPTSGAAIQAIYGTQYIDSKYYREDNTPEHAAYLGYLNTQDLYPDFKYITFDEFLVDLKNEKITKPYSGIV